MKVTIEIDDELMGRVDNAVNIAEMPREIAFKQALESWVMHMPSRPPSYDWLSLEGDPNFEGFEAYRDPNY